MATVYTIGYEGTDIDRFVATLKAVGVKVLVDVRALPLSRKKGFSKTLLRSRIEAEGLQYLHLGHLGDPKEGRDAARSGRFDDFRAIYTRHLSQSEPQLALKKLASLVTKQSACLMCFERDPTECHRLMVASRLPKQVGVFHLFGDDPDRYVRHATKLPRRRTDQSAAAAQ
jgi:uncharacterized protein (DUF488 family)